ncbi:transglycosylase SLT domain-containing protein [Candidatus Woesearchaeota archaeon]|nr:transglycosylase SLT domain-containing protein [Candidatus Woesearchaeota archaeon]
MGIRNIRAWAAAGAFVLGLGAGAYLWNHYPSQKAGSPPAAEIQEQPLKESKDPIGDLHTKVIKEGTALPLKKKDTKNSAFLADVLYSDPEGVTTTLTGIWEKDYTEGKFKTSLETAIKRSQHNLAYAKHIFAQEGVPTELAFLAIPESHWDAKANSGKAVGLYQFIEQTAKAHGAIISPGYDSRLHPLESAGLAAKELKDLYKRHRRDWLLALAGYNSGMPNKYRGVANQFGDGKVSYSNYLLFLGGLAEVEARKNLNTAKKLPSHIQFPTKGSLTLDMVLTRLKVPPTSQNRTELQEANKDKIFPLTYQTQDVPKKSKKTQAKKSKKAKKTPSGAVEVTIPLSIREQQVKQSKRIGYIHENLHYPPKYLAITHILKERHPNYYNTPSQPHPFYVHTLPKESQYKKHIVTRGGTLSKISKQYNLSMGVLKSENGLKNNKLSIGQELKIPTLNPTLPDIARQYGAPLEILARDNPQAYPVAIKGLKGKRYLPLPNSARIYIQPAYAKTNLPR